MKHENLDFSQVKWGMTVLKYMRSAFERQIAEAVEIEKENNRSELLNSKSEYNQSTLPRLVTRIGDTEKEMKDLEKEMEEEKLVEEMLETKIRELRKARNKARLKTETNKPNKRQKLENTDYITNKEVWVQPTKRKRVDEEKDERKKKETG